MSCGTSELWQAGPFHVMACRHVGLAQHTQPVPALPRRARTGRAGGRTGGLVGGPCGRREEHAYPQLERGVLEHALVDAVRVVDAPGQG